MGLRLAGMLALTGALTGFFVSFAVPHRYVATSTLRFIRPAGLPKDMYDRESHAILDATATRAFSEETLNALIARSPRLREMLSADPAEEIIARLRDSSRLEFVSLPNGADGIRIRFEDDDMELALDVNRELAVTIGRVAMGASPMGDGKEVTEMAGVPVAEASGATAPKTTAAGFGAGLTVGLLAWAIYAGTSRKNEPKTDPKI